MIVEFDAEKFKALHPQWADADETTLAAYFSAACLLLDNTDKSRVQDGKEREKLLYLLTCHIATLAGRGSATVGTLMSATEGKVSASFSGAANANWYSQTQCGYLYWLATAKYRRGIWYADKCR